MSKPSVVTLRIPKELKARLEAAADQQGVSLNQFALYILAGEVARLEASQQEAWQDLEMKYFKGRSREDILAQARRVLQKVQPGPVPDWDKAD